MKRLTITVIMAAISLLMAQAQQVVEVKYNGSSATVNIPGEISDEVTSSVTDANVVINSTTTTKEYTYKVSGKSTDGSLVITGVYKLTLQLAGIDLTNAGEGPAINIQCGKRIAVELVKGTVNRLADSAGGTHKGAIHFKGHAEFEGGGTLFVTGKTKHAIDVKEYLELKRTTGTINILGAVSDGIHCGKGKASAEHNYFQMKGGIVNIQNVGSDGIDSDDYGVIRIDGGSVSVNVPTGGTGLKADSLVQIRSGNVSLSVTGDDAEGIRSRYATTISGGKFSIAVSGNGSKGIKGKQVTDLAATVRNGGYVTITGGEINMQTTGANLEKVDEDGQIDVDKCMGLSVDADFMQTAGALSITALGEEARTYNVKGTENRAGGTFEAVKAPWGMDALSYQYDMSAYVAVTKNGTALTDYAPVAVGAFIDGKCVGYAVFQNNNYGIMRIRSNSSAGGKAVTFKLYEYDEMQEYDLTPEAAVTYGDGTCTGTPSAPLKLNYVQEETTVLPKIVPDDLTREYGEANPQLTYKVTEGELKAGDGTPELSTKAVKTSNVGNYPITVGKGTLTVKYKSTEGTLTITKAPLTATAKNITIKQGEAMPAFEATYTGFKNGETESVLTQQPTFTCTATSASAPGTYDITLEGAEALNYDITYAKGTLTIVDADKVVVTAKDYSREYGEVNPVFEYTSAGKELDGTPVISCEATEQSPVGTYPIVIKKGSVKNYNDSYVNGTLTVTKAPLTIKATNCSVKQGEAMPTFEVTYTGFKNGETEKVLTKKPTITCVAKSGDVPGAYEIVVSGAEAQNYDITFVKGTLTIVEADKVVVTAANATRKYGEKNPAFTYTSAGKALDGTPAISCEATEQSPVGTYPIVVQKGTVKNYNDHYVNGTLTVTKAPLTITAVNTSVKQGEAMPTFEVTYSGFKNGETEKVLTKKPTITCAAKVGDKPGSYEIVVSGAEAQNYDITFVNGTLTIYDANAVVVTAANAIREYGEKNPTFEYTVAGMALDGTPVISCEATEQSPVGTYPIVVQKGTVKNYNDTYVNGTLTVTKAPLTIKANNYSVKQGEALPTFEVTYSGFKNGEKESVLTKKPTITCAAKVGDKPGSYEIVVSGAEAQNYDITFVNATLTIVEADAVVVTAKDATREYGDANPVFEYTSTGVALDGEPALSCEVDEVTPVGTYPIVVKKGTVKNYNVSYVDGTLTITKAPLTVTAKSYTIQQGEALPSFGVRYEGFKNKEKATVLTQVPTIICEATSDSEPGTYDILVGNAEAQNYSFIYVKGTLTITPADTPEPDAIGEVKATQGNKPRKVLVGKEVRILRGEHEYDINGRKQP